LIFRAQYSLNVFDISFVSKYYRFFSTNSVSISSVTLFFCGLESRANQSVSEILIGVSQDLIMLRLTTNEGKVMEERDPDILQMRDELDEEWTKRWRNAAKKKKCSAKKTTITFISNEKLVQMNTRSHQKRLT